MVVAITLGSDAEKSLRTSMSVLPLKGRSYGRSLPTRVSWVIVPQVETQLQNQGGELACGQGCGEAGDGERTAPVVARPKNGRK